MDELLAARTPSFTRCSIAKQVAKASAKLDHGYVHESNCAIKKIVLSIERWLYFSSMLLGTLGLLYLTHFTSVPVFIGWILIAWFAVEAMIKITTKVSKNRPHIQ